MRRIPRILVAIVVAGAMIIPPPVVEACGGSIFCVDCYQNKRTTCWFCIFSTFGGCDCTTWGFGDGTCDQCIAFGWGCVMIAGPTALDVKSRLAALERQGEHNATTNVAQQEDTGS